MDEVTNPQDTPRITPIIVETTKIVRYPKTYTLKTLGKEKEYKLVFNKRVLDRNTFTSYPYGFKAKSIRHTNSYNPLFFIIFSIKTCTCYVFYHRPVTFANIHMITSTNQFYSFSVFQITKHAIQISTHSARRNFLSK